MLEHLLLGEAEDAAYRKMYSTVCAHLGQARSARQPTASMDDLYLCLRQIQGFEAWAAHGAWISQKERNLGPAVKERFEYGSTIDFETYQAQTKRRDLFRSELSDLLKDDGVMVMPTVPGAAPLVTTSFDDSQAYRERCVRLFCLSGLSGFPQITLPLGEVHGAPFGISLLGPRGSDLALIRLGRGYFGTLRKGRPDMDTLTRMRAFIDVVEAEGFSAAARKIGRSKALLSKYVRELEDELGALLLNRTTRQFSLTEAGHTYYRRASEILREVESLQEAVRESSSDIKGRIKISAPRTFADADVGQCLVDFCAEQPDIVLDVRLDDRFVDLVEEGFDLAIRITRMQDSSLIAKRIAPFARYRYAARQHWSSVWAGPARPSRLAGLPCIIDTNNRTRNAWQFHNDDGAPLSDTGRRDPSKSTARFRGGGQRSPDLGLH